MREEVGSMKMLVGKQVLKQE